MELAVQKIEGNICELQTGRAAEGRGTLRRHAVWIHMKAGERRKWWGEESRL